MSFCSFIGHKQAKLSLILNLIEPGIGGVLFVGDKGSGKSTLARSVRDLLPWGVAFVDVPLNVTEEMLLGCVDIEEAVKTGNRVQERGLISQAQGGVFYVDDVNLLSADALNLVLNVRDRAGPAMPASDRKSERSPSFLQLSTNKCPTSVRHTGEGRYPGRFLDSGSPPKACGDKLHRNDALRRGSPYSVERSFILVGTINPEEGFISSHAIDRFGLCCAFESTSERADRLRIAKRAIAEGNDGARYARWEMRLKRKIDEAKRLLPSVVVSNRIRDAIVTACLDAGVAGHRGDLTLQRAAAAYAAFCGDAQVDERHLAKVLPMVLMHRMRTVQQQPNPDRREQQKQDPEPPKDQDEKDAEQNRTPPDRPESEEKTPPETRGPEPPEPHNSNRSSRTDEEIFAVGDPFKVRRLVFGKDRKERWACGRRTQTKFAGKGGRYVKSTLRPREHDIAVDATLRAAAPWQRFRGRSRRMVIHEEDLRFKERERKMGHVVIFAVDCSGSMGAKRRMIETKGAILSLLTDCYHKRDRVAMIAFRKDRAELLLPPTSSVQLASARLKELPVGGKTPLGAGLLETYKLIRRVSGKDPHTRFVVVVISDGRANQGMTELPVKEEVARCAGLLLELRHTDYLVVDTEDKSGFMRADLAAGLASLLQATYFTTSDLKAEYLTQIVNNH